MSPIHKPPAHHLLSFAQFRAQHSGRSQSDIYNPKTESFPDEPWYALEHDGLNHSIRSMCDDLLQLLNNFSVRHSELVNLKTALQSATIIPRGQRFYGAFLGEQGIGKSSIINAVFDRELVNVSGSSSACTAYPTIITHKEGTMDDTTSDIRIEFLNMQELRNSTEEQIRRYTAAFPFKKSKDSTDHEMDVEEYMSDEDIESVNSAEDRESIHLTQDLPDRELTRDAGRRNRTRIPQAVLRGAKTAKAYFEIVFDTHRDESRRLQLEYWLENTDIENNDFLDDCLTMVKERLATLGAQEGHLTHFNIPDRDLAATWSLAQSVYPLVKAFHLATDHVLLRNNICVLDLPGYGDDNQIRTALIDRYRKMTHFEIVVAPSSRVMTSVIQERYLDRSIRRLNGAQNTLLVTNKSDQLVNEIRRSLNTLGEAPFPELRDFLADSLARRGNASISDVRAYKEYILREARRAFIEREAAIVEQQMQTKHVEVLSVSAREYALCVDPLQDEEPKISPEATGIPALRRYLFTLPAQTNYRTLHHHVFETLPDLVIQIKRILDKFSNSEDYTRMRVLVIEQLAKLREMLESLATSLPREHVASPWTASDRHVIIPKLTSIINDLAQPAVYYMTFEKMLRENGIPVNGKALGRNLNEEVLATMSNYIETWNVKTMTQIETLAAKLESPLGILQKNVKDCIGDFSGNPDLKQAADDALDRTSRRLGMAYGKLSAALTSTLRENYLHFTTEINIECPFAQELKPVYQDTLQQQGGSGAYARKRNYLSQAITYKSSQTTATFVERMEAQIIKRQVDGWSQCCDDFVKEVIALLEEYERITRELLDDEAHTSPEFGQAQERLKAALPLFEQRLQLLQEQFSEAKMNPHHGTPNTKRKRGDRHSTEDNNKTRGSFNRDRLDRAESMQCPTSSAGAGPSDFPNKTGYGRAMSAQPVAHKRQKFLMRFQKPVITERDTEVIIKDEDLDD